MVVRGAGQYLTTQALLMLGNLLTQGDLLVMGKRSLLPILMLNVGILDGGRITSPQGGVSEKGRFHSGASQLLLLAGAGERDHVDQGAPVHAVPKSASAVVHPPVLAQIVTIPLERDIDMPLHHGDVIEQEKDPPGANQSPHLAEDIGRGRINQGVSVQTVVRINPIEGGRTTPRHPGMAAT